MKQEFLLSVSAPRGSKKLYSTYHSKTQSVTIRHPGSIVTYRAHPCARFAV